MARRLPQLPLSARCALRRMVPRALATPRERQLQRALQRERSRDAALLEAVDEAVWSVDRCYRLLVGNSAFHRTVEGTLHVRVQPGDDLLAKSRAAAPERARHWQTLYDRALAGEQVTEEESYVLDGRRHFLLVSLYPSRAGGRVTGVACYTKDITARKEAEERGRRTEQRLAAIFQASPLPTLVCTRAEGRLVDLNPAAARMLGYRPEELMGPAVGRLQAWCSPEERARLEGELAGRGAVLDHEFRVRDRKGVEHHLVGSVVPIRLGGEECLLHLAFDLTEHRQLQRLLHQSQERFEKLFATSPAAVLVTTLQEGRIVDLNEAAERLFRRPRGELVGRTTVELGLWERPADRALLAQRLAREGAARHFESRLRADGELRDVLVSAAVIELEGERCIVAVTEDVTERKRLLEELRRSQEHFQRLFQLSPLPTFVCRLPEGELTRFNDAARQLFGLGPRAEGRSGRQLGLWVQPDDHARFLAAAARAEAVHDVEADLRARDGGVRHLLLSAARLGTEGAPCLLVVAEDVTARRRVEEQLRQAARMQAFGQVSGGVAHDFNNLLTVIGGCGELLGRMLPAEGEPRALVSQIERASARAAHLTRQLLAFGGRQLLQPSLLDLNDVVQGVAEPLRRILGPSVELVLALSPRLGAVRADRRQVEQVLFNLATNARDAMPAGGRFVIHTDRAHLGPSTGDGVPPGPYVLLAVSDSGRGMDEHTREHLFEPFFTTKDAAPGRGLGLASVYGIVRQSDGHILVHSAPGEGTTFQIYLPLQGALGAQAAPGAGLLPADGASPTVLLVEDEAELRELLQEVLETEGFVVLPARDGQEAVRIAREERRPIHLLLSDIVMPRLGGPAAAVEVRRLRPGIRVAFMSGYPGNGLSHLPLDAPADAYLQKPFSLDTLAQRLRLLLAPPRAEITAH